MRGVRAGARGERKIRIDQFVHNWCDQFERYANQEKKTYRIICIVAVNGLSTLIASMNVCNASFSGLPVSGRSQHKSGISLVDDTPENRGDKVSLHY